MLKYIVFDDDSLVLFNNKYTHNDYRMMGKTPVSAGYYDFEKHEVWGESVSLSLSYNDNDLKIIEDSIINKD